MHVANYSKLPDFKIKLKRDGRRKELLLMMSLRSISENNTQQIKHMRGRKNGAQVFSQT